jgi:hypothetical protein
MAITVGLDGDGFLSKPKTSCTHRHINWASLYGCKLTFHSPLQANPCNARFGCSTCHPSLDFWFYHLGFRYACVAGKLSSTRWWLSHWLYLRNPCSPIAHRSIRWIRWTSQDCALQNFAVHFEAGARPTFDVDQLDPRRTDNAMLVHRSQNRTLYVQSRKPHPKCRGIQNTEHFVGGGGVRFLVGIVPRLVWTLPENRLEDGGQYIPVRTADKGEK